MDGETTSPPLIDPFGLHSQLQNLTLLPFFPLLT